MNEQQLLHYSRQILLPEIDYTGQARLLRARVLIVGLGGLGSPVALYLAAAGVGYLMLADYDRVDLSNLQRQIAHTRARIGQPKVFSAAAAIRAINADVQVECIDARPDPDTLRPYVRAADVVIDCTDNFASRFTLNALCVNTMTPLVSGAAIRFAGQVSVFNPCAATSPCYRCLYPDNLEEEENSCSDSGILAPVVGIIGAIQATETIKLLTGIGESLCGRVLILDALQMEWRTLRLPRDPACPVCATRPQSMSDA